MVPLELKELFQRSYSSSFHQQELKQDRKSTRPAGGASNYVSEVLFIRVTYIHTYKANARGPSW